MPTKPTDNVPEFASLANFGVGGSGIIGTPTKNTIGLATAVENGAVPWLAESPLTGQHFNEWMHRGWALLDWVYQGSIGPAADAHIVETDADGRAFLVAAADATDATLHVEVTGTGGQAIIAEAGNSHAINATNNSDTDAAIFVRNTSALSGSRGVQTLATGDGVGMFAGVSGAGGAPIAFQAAMVSGVSTAARGFSVELDAVEATGVYVGSGTNSGIGAFFDVGDGSFCGISCYSSTGSQRLVRLQHEGSGTCLEVSTFGTAAGAVIDGSGSANVSGALQVTGNGGFASAIAANTNVTSSSSTQALARAAIIGSAAPVSGGRAVGLYGLATDSPGTFGVGVYGASSGTNNESAGVIGDGTLDGGDAHGLFAISSTQRSQLRLQPIVADAPLNGRVGDVAAVDPSSSSLNEGLVTYADGAWQRVAHTPRRTRETQVGFSNSSSIVGTSTSAPLAEALFTAADGGDVIIRVSFGYSRSAVGDFQVSIKSDDGVGGAVTTHLSLRNVRVLSSTGAATSVAGVWSWIRKITPTNTGQRRYYIEVTEPSAATTLYYWDVGLSVEGEVTP